MRGLITNLQRFSIHDGPGIRTTVFMKGCPLHCLWCHNPENLTAVPELAFTQQRCIGCGACARVCPHNAHEFGDTHALHRERCEVCGACVEACPSKALEVLGQEMTVEQVLAVVERDRPFYETSGGGMTLSGGEPLAQAEFTGALLMRAKEVGLHTALDTCGHAPWSVFAQVLPFVDLWLYDLKHADPERHCALTGVSNAQLLDNLRHLLAEGAKVVLRMPLIPGLNDAEADLAQMAQLVAEFRGVEELHLMPYHRLAEAKYARLGKAFACTGIEPPSADRMEAVSRRFEAAGVKVSIGGG